MRFLPGDAHSAFTARRSSDMEVKLPFFMYFSAFSEKQQLSVCDSGCLVSQERLKVIGWDGTHRAVWVSAVLCIHEIAAQMAFACLIAVQIFLFWLYNLLVVLAKAGITIVIAHTLHWGFEQTPGADPSTLVHNSWVLLNCCVLLLFKAFLLLMLGGYSRGSFY